jgi:hypothetical protein
VKEGKEWGFEVRGGGVIEREIGCRKREGRKGGGVENWGRRVS